MLHCSIVEHSLLKVLSVGSTIFFSLVIALMAHYISINFKMCQIRNETPELAKGAAKAVYDLYEVVTHDLLSSDLRYVDGLYY